MFTYVERRSISLTIKTTAAERRGNATHRRVIVCSSFACSSILRSCICIKVCFTFRRVLLIWECLRWSATCIFLRQDGMRANGLPRVRHGVVQIEGAISICILPDDRTALRGPRCKTCESQCKTRWSTWHVRWRTWRITLSVPAFP